ncbi:MAG: DNA polymerase IV [Candidatus Micrarchaeota archaeon]|nr:DNA polymerase IV [Candidatus Micrarchaeota archaeon]
MGLFLHVDMDYFYAACEEARHPELKGKPLAVGTQTIENRLKGVVQTCNYEARRLGIHSAMPTAMAFKLCPTLNYMPDDWKHYLEMSGRVMETIKSRGLKTEVISVDEAVMDLGEMDYGRAEELGNELKSEISEKLGLPCTIGISVGKTYAKMVCDASKPNGLGVLKGEDVKSFLRDKEVTKLLGIGEKTAERLKEMKITTIGDLARAKPLVLESRFGSWGKEMYLLANGIDNGKVVENAAALSIGRERTFGRDTDDLEDIGAMMKELAHEVMEEVGKQGYWFKGIGVKARYPDFTEKIKNRKLSNYTDSEKLLYSIGMELIKPLVDERRVRKVGIRVYELNPKKGQRSL